MKSDKIVKWFFMAIVLCLVVVTAGMFFVSEETHKEAQLKSEKIAEKMRYKPSKSE